MSSNDEIKDTNTLLQTQHTHITALTKIWHNYADQLDKTTDAHRTLQEAIAKGEGGYQAMVTSLAQMGEATDAMLTTMSSFVGILPGLSGQTSQAMQSMNVLGEAFKVASDKLALFGEQISYFDSFSSAIRQSEAQMRGFSGAFGEGVEEARRLSEAMLGPDGLRMALASEEYGYIGGEQIAEFTKAMAGANLETGYMTETVSVAGKEMSLLGVGILQAGSMGMETAAYVSKLGDAIMKQGLSAQQAVEQMAGFRIVARETGLSVSTVMEGLKSATQQFNVLGMTADFAKPAMLGFADSLDSMGLGMENASQLAADLTSSLAGVIQSYEKAYLLQIRGGLDFGGGGGAIGAGVQLQAAMLNAEGDTAAQTDLASSMTDSMAETLRSFGGGRIVTVNEAAQDPSSQNTFYMQQQLLQGQFGMGQESATRTLEMLSELESATASGDEQLAAELRDQINSEVEGRNETVDELKKLNVIATAQLGATMQSNRDDIMRARGTAAGRRGVATEESAAFNASYSQGLQDAFSPQNLASVQTALESLDSVIRSGGETVMGNLDDRTGGMVATGERARRAIEGIATSPVASTGLQSVDRLILDQARTHSGLLDDLKEQNVDIKTYLFNITRDFGTLLARVGGVTR
mgnify:CR=1 FL=1